jgi:hypothetical protein
MEFKFKLYPLSSSLISSSYRAMININIKNGTRSLNTLAMIDSGADTCLINSGWAEALLFSDYRKEKHDRTQGISGKPLDVYYHDLEYEINGLDGSKQRAPFGFVQGLSESILLGRYGFFDRFKVTFDQKNGLFEIEI